MKAVDKILKAKVQLILDQPFFAAMALHLKYIEDNSIKCGVTNGKQLRYNPSAIEQLSIDEVKGLLTHEVLHIALLHHTRRNKRDLRKWNKAADYAINQILLSSGFSLPADVFISTEFEHKSAEQSGGDPEPKVYVFHGAEF